MTRTEQMAINVQCTKIWNEAMDYYGSPDMRTVYPYEWERLDYCQAEVFKTERFYYLRSYRTVIAVIDVESDTCVDMLRYVYGYTATSAKHISKFRRLGSGKWGCAHELTWRSC